jgi:putative transposase
MEEDTVVRLPQPGGSVADDPLLEVLRSGARRMLQQVIEAEVEASLGAHADLEDERGRRRVVRNGHAPEREIQTGIGPIAVRRPKVRDRGDGTGAEPIRFTSKVLPPFLRRTRNVEELLPWLYLKGISTGQFGEALSALLGPDAPGLSASTVGRLVATWQQEHDRWQGRDLSTRRYVYVWADGVYFTPRLDHDRQCMLVLIGADAHGKKELLAIEDGYRESTQSWRELLLRLRDENGLAAAPELAIGDGALGFWKALHEVWPSTRQQRCWVHSVPRGHTRCQEGDSHDLTRAMSVSLHLPAGESPVRVITREPGSRLPASGGNARRRSAVSKALFGGATYRSAA